MVLIVDPGNGIKFIWVIPLFTSNIYGTKSSETFKYFLTRPFSFSAFIHILLKVPSFWQLEMNTETALEIYCFLLVLEHLKQLIE